jgi:putative SOS response-associated peptidase YedK
MPAILPPDIFNLWLNHYMHDPEQLQSLYLPFSVQEMPAHDLVNNPRFDSPLCIARV